MQISEMAWRSKGMTEASFRLGKDLDVKVLTEEGQVLNVSHLEMERETETIWIRLTKEDVG